GTATAAAVSSTVPVEDEPPARYDQVLDPAAERAPELLQRGPVRAAQEIQGAPVGEQQSATLHDQHSRLEQLIQIRRSLGFCRYIPLCHIHGSFSGPRPGTVPRAVCPLMLHCFNP